MRHYARLANVGLPSDRLNAKIDELIAQLGLTEQKGTIVGDLFLKGLSGGQKRRLSIALEALSSPDNFLLDEPTSGLDAESALQVMEFLRAYARGAAGRRVVLTIHQPSTFIWERIDNVVLLSKGMVVYEGSRGQMEDFFASCGHPTPQLWNCADHYVRMVNDEFRDHVKSVQEWVDLYSSWEQRHGLEGESNASMVAIHVRDKAARSESMQEASDLIRNQAKRSSSFRASFELTSRYFLNLWFNPGILFTRVAMYSMLAAMVGGLFWKLGERTDYESILSRTAVSFYCVAFFIFMSVAVLPFTVMERDIVDKEVQNGYYHPIAYQVAQGLASIPAAGLLAGLVTMIIILMLEFQDSLLVLSQHVFGPVMCGSVVAACVACRSAFRHRDGPPCRPIRFFHALSRFHDHSERFPGQFEMDIQHRVSHIFLEKLYEDRVHRIDL